MVDLLRWVGDSFGYGWVAMIFLFWIVGTGLYLVKKVVERGSDAEPGVPGVRKKA